jgi:hypothetical protein
MKKFSTILITLVTIFTFMFSGCSMFSTPNAQQSKQLVFNGLVIAQSAATIYTQYNPVTTIIASHTDKMSPEDVATLVTIKTNYNTVYNQFKDLQTGKVNIRAVAVDYTTFYNTFTQLETDYVKVVKIINNYSMLFTPTEMQTLVAFENACTYLNNEFNDINAQLKKNDNTAEIATDITQLLQDTLIIANTVSSIAVMIK